MNQTNEINAKLLRNLSSANGGLAQQVHQSIKQAILALDFPPGAILRKGPICEKLGVSRAPVAEAISRLSTEGLVDVVPQSATRVAYFSMDEIREGVFIREALELAVVDKVARNITDDQRKKLTRNIRMQDLLVEDNDTLGFYEADEEFHHLLMNFTGFNGLSELSERVLVHVSRARILLLPTPGRLTETRDEHRAVHDAVCAGDPARARDTMKRHLGQLLPRLEKLRDERPELFNLAGAGTRTESR